jgi:hypothetical protein
MKEKTLKEKLEMIISLSQDALALLGEEVQREKISGSSSVQKETDSSNLVLDIINKVADCDEADEIKEYILDKRGSEGRVLLPYYISYKYFGNAWIGAGEIEKITSELGIKIDTRNVSNYLKEYRSSLESGSVRKRGQSTPYRLNRKGLKRFEEIIHVKKS